MNCLKGQDEPPHQTKVTKTDQEITKQENIRWRLGDDDYTRHRNIREAGMQKDSSNKLQTKTTVIRTKYKTQSSRLLHITFQFDIWLLVGPDVYVIL